jgi:response regulator RpfG family c-di-GMP phosphodiesterase
VLDANAPIAAVITDQRMPEMTGVEFLARVYERHPNTTRIILTGYADGDSMVRAINEGHVYAYVAKPWEPDALKQLVHRAVELHRLRMQNERLLDDVQQANRFLAAAIDEVPVGALVGRGGSYARHRSGRDTGLRAIRGRALAECSAPMRCASFATPHASR